MFESILTISITGFLAGFIFAMPIAGPISILIASNALKGRLRYSNLISIGAAFADFTYIFIAVYGLTRLYSFYKPAIPYLFIAGSVFFILLGIKIFRTKVDLEYLEEKSHLTEKIQKKNKERGAFYTGLMVNFLNPTIFLGGLTSSFFVISLIASIGLNTGGLDLKIDKHVKEISSIEGKKIENNESIQFRPIQKLQENNNKISNHEETYPPYFHLIISLCYALFISTGSIAWFHFMGYLLVKYRKNMNLKILSFLIKCFGVILWLLGLYFGYLGLGKFGI